MATSEDMSVCRPLEPGEQELIEVLLSGARSGAIRYIGQLERIQVVGSCGCGCSTLKLEMPSGPRQGAPEALILADGETGDGTPVSVILWVRGGALSGLEAHAWDGGDLVGLPRPESVTNIRSGS